MPYILVEGTRGHGQTSLQYKVTKLMEEGWTPHGSPFQGATKRNKYQAMVKD